MPNIITRTPADDQSPVTQMRGWSRPTWATHVELTADDAPLITFSRDAEDCPGFGTLTLTRTDLIDADGVGAVTTTPGEVLIIATDIDDLSPDEARQVAGALTELADLADHG